MRNFIFLLSLISLTVASIAFPTYIPSWFYSGMYILFLGLYSYFATYKETLLTTIGRIYFNIIISFYLVNYLKQLYSFSYMYETLLLIFRLINIFLIWKVFDNNIKNTEVLKRNGIIENLSYIYLSQSDNCININ